MAASATLKIVWKFAARRAGFGSISVMADRIGIDQRQRDDAADDPHREIAERHADLGRIAAHAFQQRIEGAAEIGAEHHHESRWASITPAVARDMMNSIAATLECAIQAKNADRSTRISGSGRDRREKVLEDLRRFSIGWIVSLRR